MAVTDFDASKYLYSSTEQDPRDHLSLPDLSNLVICKTNCLDWRIKKTAVSVNNND